MTDEAQRPRGYERRRRPTRPWDVLWTAARRQAIRRSRDRAAARAGFVDRHGPVAFVLAIALLLLTLLDGVLTLVLLGHRHEESNPVMAYLIDRGALWFLCGKYALTAAGLPVLLSLKDYRMFGTRFRVGALLPIFVGLYLLLAAGQVALLTAHDAGPTTLPSPARVEGTGRLPRTKAAV
jgi:hypothetical protein